MISRVHSLLIHVPDLEVASADYARLLGRRPIRWARSVEGQRRSCFFSVGNVSLELCQPEPSAGVAMGQAGLRLALDAEMQAVGEETRLRERLAARSLRVGRLEQVETGGEAGAGPRRHGRLRVEPGSSRGLPMELVLGEQGEVAEDPATGSGPDPSGIVTGLDHLVVLSPSPEDSLRLYRDALGLRLALDRSFEQRGVRLIFFRVGGTTIEIGARLGSPPQPERNDAFGGLAWRVEDVDAIRSRLVAEGFDVSEVRAGHKPGTRVCTVRGPTHGVGTLLIQAASSD